MSWSETKRNPDWQVVHYTSNEELKMQVWQPLIPQLMQEEDSREG